MDGCWQARRPIHNAKTEYRINKTQCRDRPQQKMNGMPLTGTVVFFSYNKFCLVYLCFRTEEFLLIYLIVICQPVSLANQFIHHNTTRRAILCDSLSPE